ncbi:tyrosine-type recombinase/integrase [Vitiosangium sp. GDMCC 1.1324]|uniref:tyrosine-type recombinase/integrase n=1 Tax=Vitiosangium sp. (strain GDMCC 1.1324) TaxID=2138576 RepID=UPI000D3342EC|nr:tyrosine-type recombinase/integrase [Vitiosangium sp. GDMCC 1.1324]PTL79109.1 hypothetical protein DAT35_36500 [Vitiosangium sp. GDMCC 1.1324]
MTRAYFRYKRGRAGKKEAPVNGTWWVDYRDGAGRRRQERTTARLKAEAERVAQELAEKGYRQRKGLEVEGPTPVTFAETAKRYRVGIRHLESYPDVDAQLRLYLEPILGKKFLAEITPADVDACINRYRDELAPATLKALQTRIGAVYRWAIRKAKLYRGDNPVHEATKVDVPERLPRFLTVEQLERLFDAAGSDRVIHLFASLTGMRKGEVAGLMWNLVDMERHLITVRYCYDRPRTKGRRDRIVPIHPELLPVLREMQRTATSPWVFPNPSGGMRTEDWDAAANFKAALVRAGLVDGYEYLCVTRGKRKSCGYREVRQEKKPAVCPQCGMRLWPRGLPLNFTFKDLRSTFATHLAEMGDLRLVQRLLGHVRPEITERAYAAARVEYLRRGVEGLQLTRDKSGTPRLAASTTNINEVQKG